jgi:hypothetical protein
MKLHKKSVSKPAVKAKMDEFVRNRHNIRAKYELLGVGLNSSGSYLVGDINRSECDRLVGIKNKKIVGKPMFMVLESGKGQLVREVVSADKNLFTVNGKLMSRKVFPPGMCEILTQTEFAKLLKHEAALKKNEVIELRTRGDQKHLTGLLLGEITRPYSALVYAKEGKLHIRNVETKANIHNAREVCSLVSSKPDPGRVKSILSAISA